MLITDRFSGNNELFVGNRLSELRRIPVGASIISARAVIIPLRFSSSDQEGVSEDTINFPDGISVTGENGETKIRNNVANGFEEIDFHRRVTLLRMNVSNVSGASLQVDIGGGTFVEINNRGAFKAPGDADFPIVNLSNQLPGLEVNKFRLSQVNTPIVDINNITVRNIARNVSLAIGEASPFFLHPGDLINAQTSIDFSEMLQASLAVADQDNGFYRVPLNLHSESLSRVALEVSVEYVQSNSVLPTQLSSVKLPYLFNGASESASNEFSIAIPEGARVLPRQTSAKVIGSFASSKIVQGSLDKADPTAPSIAVSTGRIQAQAFSIDPEIQGEDVAVDSVDVLLTSVSPVARVQLDLREDLDGRPGSESLLGSQPELQLSTDTSATPTWSNATLGAPIKLAKTANGNGGRRYWLLLQSLDGEVAWSIGDGSADPRALLQQSQDGGLSWRTTVVKELATAPKAEFRLRQNTDTFQVPVSVKVGTGAAATRLSLAKFEPLGRIDFNLDGADLGDTINGYLQATERDRPPEGEQLINHEFELELDMPSFTLLGWEQIGPGLSPLGEPLSAIAVGHDIENSGISQSVPAIPGGRYELTVRIERLLGDGSKVELIWRGDDCTPTKVDELRLLRLNVESQKFTDTFRLRSTAPEGANQVEVRLVVPAGSSAQIDSISLVASPQAIPNGDLLEVGDDLIRGWTIRPKEGLTNNLIDTFISDGARVFNNHGDFIQPVTISQLVPVEAGQSFTFDFIGKLRSSSEDAAAVPEVNLRFFDDGGSEVNNAHKLVVGPDSSNQQSFAGVVPDAATQAEVSIAMPPSTELEVSALSLQLRNIQQVPIAFLSESPGELTVSDIRVGFEQQAAAPLPVPEAGFCDATPADQAPGDDCCDDACKCFCPHCGKHAEIKQTASVQLTADRSALIGICVDCGLQLYKNSGLQLSETKLVPIRRINRSIAAEIEVAESTIPLTEIAYIGNVRAAKLMERNINSINKLAATTPRELADTLDVNEELAESFVDQAKELLDEERLKKAGIVEGNSAS